MKRQLLRGGRKTRGINYNNIVSSNNTVRKFFLSMLIIHKNERRLGRDVSYCFRVGRVTKHEKTNRPTALIVSSVVDFFPWRS